MLYCDQRSGQKARIEIDIARRGGWSCVLVHDGNSDKVCVQAERGFSHAALDPVSHIRDLSVVDSGECRE